MLILGEHSCVIKFGSQISLLLVIQKLNEITDYDLVETQSLNLPLSWERNETSEQSRICHAERDALKKQTILFNLHRLYVVWAVFKSEVKWWALWKSQLTIKLATAQSTQFVIKKILLWEMYKEYSCFIKFFLNLTCIITVLLNLHLAAC